VNQLITEGRHEKVSSAAVLSDIESSFAFYYYIGVSLPIEKNHTLRVTKMYPQRRQKALGFE
jgi:hypothetical protein